MATMNVSLPDDLVEFVKGETADGGYGNQSDVVRDGLRLLREQKQKRVVLMRLLEEGEAAVAAGRTKPLTTALLRDIAERAKERAKKGQRKT
jgi:antitoxin ParD1/3/4